MKLFSFSQSRLPARHLAASAVLALFFVLFLWNFFSVGPLALGINAAVFFAGLVTFLSITILDKKPLDRSLRTWMIPLLLITLSFALYENPFIKIANLLVLPVVMVVFFNVESLKHNTSVRWTIDLLMACAFRILDVLRYFSKAAEQHTSALGHGSKSALVIKKILTGVVLFALLAIILIIPLLASADTAFADALDAFYVWFTEYVEIETLLKVIVFAFLTLLFTGTALAWGKPLDAHSAPETQRDSITAGTVLIGIVGLYGLFLWFQVERLWLRELPFVFEETEYLVKSGFWQLIVLSVINILIFLLYYRKTNTIVQRILALFTCTSLLLVLSAAHRMWLYVTTYGFSYEKFYAAYTVLFCLILFGWLISRFFTTHSSDVIKFIAFQFLWMYALVSIFPVEQFVLRTNVALAARPESRIHLYELRMLSGDVLGTVEMLKEEGKLNSEADETRIQQRIDEEMIYIADAVRNREEYFESNRSGVPPPTSYPNDYHPSDGMRYPGDIDNGIDAAQKEKEMEVSIRNEYDWTNWIEMRKSELEEKPWYQYTLTNAIYAASSAPRNAL